jgi:hypothetical protein
MSRPERDRGERVERERDFENRDGR